MYTLGSVGKVEGETGLLTTTTWTRGALAGGGLGQEEPWGSRKSGAGGGLGQEKH